MLTKTEMHKSFDAGQHTQEVQNDQYVPLSVAERRLFAALRICGRTTERRDRMCRPRGVNCNRRIARRCRGHRAIRRRNFAARHTGGEKMTHHQWTAAQIAEVADAARQYCANPTGYMEGIRIIVSVATAWQYAILAANACWALAQDCDRTNQKHRSAIFRRRAEEWQQAAKHLRPIGRQMARKINTRICPMFA